MSLLIGLIIAIAILVISVKMIVKLVSPPAPPELSREWHVKVQDIGTFIRVGIQRGNCYHHIGQAFRKDFDFEAKSRDLYAEAKALSEGWNTSDETIDLLTQEVE